MLFEIEVSNDGYAGQRIRMTGSLNTNTAPELQRQLDSRIDAATSVLILDFDQLDFLSSAGLRVIFKAKKSMESNNGRFLLVNLQPQIRKVFEIVKALDGMTVFRDDDEMDDYLAAMQRKVLDDK